MSGAGLIPQLLIALAGIVVSIGIWIATMWLVSFFSGWFFLAKVYPRPDINGDVGQSLGAISWQMLWLRFWAKYGNIIAYEVTDRGLGIQVAWAFRFGHPHLFVPWEEFVLIERRTRFGVSFDQYRVLRRPEVPIRMLTRTAEKLDAMSAGRWPDQVTPLEPNDT